MMIEQSAMKANDRLRKNLTITTEQLMATEHKLSYADSRISLADWNLQKAEEEIERLNDLLKQRNKGFFNLTCYALALNTAGIALLSFLIWLK